jgi:hypothetical protein
LSTKFTPSGSAPLSEMAAVGVPVVVTLKLSEAPVEKSTDAEEVMEGAWSTVRVKDWVAFGLTPLLALMVKGYVPPVAGVPARVAVPLPWSTKVTPDGNAPISESDGLGNPVLVTVNDPALPSLKVVLAAEVTDGAWFTVRVKDCEAFGLFPLLAEIVIG